MANERDDATSSEMRHDWLADRWVIIAPQRTQRPFDFVRFDDKPAENVSCPFCLGCEEQTPKAVACYAPQPPADATTENRTTPPDSSASLVEEGENQTCSTAKAQRCASPSAELKTQHSSNPSPCSWSVRVVPNKFPAVNPQQVLPDKEQRVLGSVDGLASAGEGSSNEFDLFRRRDLSGGHEVIVESPSHFWSLSQLSAIETELVFQAYRDRLQYWLAEQKLSYAVVFKNVGQDAGASLVHTHSQLIATDILPPDVSRASERMKLYWEKQGACLFCKMVQDESELGARVVEATADYVAICPFASRLPALITVLPKSHQSRFENLRNPQLRQVAGLVHRMIRRLERCFPRAAYNFVIHTSPGRERHDDSFHWRLELFPRLTKVAGFEWGSDCFINPLAPEDAAKSLRSARI